MNVFNMVSWKDVTVPTTLAGAGLTPLYYVGPELIWSSISALHGGLCHLTHCTLANLTVKILFHPPWSQHLMQGAKCMPVGEDSPDLIRISCMSAFM